MLLLLKLVLRSTLEASGPVTIECSGINEDTLTFSVCGPTARYRSELGFAANGKNDGETAPNSSASTT